MSLLKTEDEKYMRISILDRKQYKYAWLFSASLAKVLISMMCIALYAIEIIVLVLL